nr:hypothetical protein Iba_chr13fCG6240 [Ipomoea batatas]
MKDLLFLLGFSKSSPCGATNRPNSVREADRLKSSKCRSLIGKKQIKAKPKQPLNKGLKVAAKVPSGNDHPPNQNVRGPLVVGVKVRFRIEVMFFIM